MAPATASLTTTMSTTTSSFLRPQQPIITNKTSALFFRLRSTTTTTGGRGVTMMASHKVTLITPNGKKDFKCSDNDYILDRAEEVGLDLPYSCRAGACSSCVGKITAGKVDQSDGNYLDDEQMEDGWVLTCVARPTSDVTIQTHKEDDLANAY